MIHRSAIAVLATVALACSSGSTPSPAPSSDAGDAAPPVDASRNDSGNVPDASSDAPACKLVRPYSSRNTACNACAERSCCAVINTCLTDPDCDDGYVNCILACALEPDSGPPCKDACATQYPRGRQEYDAAVGCADQSCKTECQ